MIMEDIRQLSGGWNRYSISDFDSADSRQYTLLSAQCAVHTAHYTVRLRHQWLIIDILLIFCWPMTRKQILHSVPSQILKIFSIFGQNLPQNSHF